MKNNSLHLSYNVCADDFTRAGEASSDLKSKLKQLDLNPEIIRKVAICMYEGEINMVIHANGGVIEVDVTPEYVKMSLKDKGPGITDIGQAMVAGYSTATENIRALGFGAGMGLPNMKKYSDSLDINTKIGTGTTVTMTINL